MDRRYPTGTMEAALAADTDYTADVKEIGSFPERVKSVLSGLSPKQLTQQYREGSWTIPTLVHHCADSHMHAYLRTKRALTEEQPAVAPYDEGPTAELPDYTLPLDATLLLLSGLHTRFVGLLAGLTAEQRARQYLHTGQNRLFSVTEVARLYAWHGRHHLAHMKLAAFEPWE